MSLTKSDLVSSLHGQCGLCRANSAQVNETVLETINSALVSGQDVLISGFGKFCVKEKGERRGRDPATGAGLHLDARKVVTFRYLPARR